MIKITRISEDDAAVTRLRVEGRITHKTTAELVGACDARVDAETPLLLDLAGVSFVDADGMRALDEVDAHGVTIVGASSFVRAILHARAAPDRSAGMPDEPAGFEALVRRHGPALLALARRLVDGEDDARDVVRDAFAEAAHGFERPPADRREVERLRRLLVEAAVTRLRRLHGSPGDASATLLPAFDANGRWVTPPARSARSLR
jgi:hypothetical protein